MEASFLFLLFIGHLLMTGFSLSVILYLIKHNLRSEGIIK